MVITPQEYTQCMVDAWNAKREEFWRTFHQTYEQNDPFPIRQEGKPSCEGKENSPIREKDGERGKLNSDT